MVAAALQSQAVVALGLLFRVVANCLVDGAAKVADILACS